MICSCVRADTILTVSKSPCFYGECGSPPHPTHLTRCWFAQYFCRFSKTMSTSSTSTFLLCPKLVCTGMFHMLLTPYNPLKFWMTHVFSKNSAYYIVSTQKMFQNNWVCRNNTQCFDPINQKVAKQCKFLNNNKVFTEFFALVFYIENFTCVVLVFRSDWLWHFSFVINCFLSGCNSFSSKSYNTGPIYKLFISGIKSLSLVIGKEKIPVRRGYEKLHVQ